MFLHAVCRGVEEYPFGWVTVALPFPLRVKYLSDTFAFLNDIFTLKLKRDFPSALSLSSVQFPFFFFFFPYYSYECALLQGQFMHEYINRSLTYCNTKWVSGSRKQNFFASIIRCFMVIILIPSLRSYQYQRQRTRWPMWRVLCVSSRYKTDRAN